MDPLVSIVLSCYNAGETLPICLNSKLNQTYANWELLALNDDSTADTGDVLKQFGDPRVRVIDDGVNQGPAARMNQLAKMAKGGFICRMDVDDIMFPVRLWVRP